MGMTMPILIAAVIVVGSICLLDLLLTFGVIRRLREHTAVLGSPPDPRAPAIGLAEGEAPGAFSAITTDGSIVDKGASLRVVAFFTTSCKICAKRVTPFADYLREHRIGRDSVLAIVGAGADGSPYLDQLTQVARVCLEQEDGAMAKAFKVHGFPAFCLLDGNGAVIASAANPAMLPEPASV
jgi:hypothetical protein